MSSLVAPSLDAPPLARYGLPEYAIGVTPAAGAAYSEKVPGNYYVRLVSVFFRFVTSATAAERTPYVEFLDGGGNRFAISGPDLTQSESTTTDYYFSAWRQSAVWEVDGSVIVPLDPTLLLPTFTWKISATAMEADDAISRVRIVYERFFTTGPAPGA